MERTQSLAVQYSMHYTYKTMQALSEVFIITYCRYNVHTKPDVIRGSYIVSYAEIASKL